VVLGERLGRVGEREDAGDDGGRVERVPSAIRASGSPMAARVCTQPVCSVTELRYMPNIGTGTGPPM